MSSFLFNTTRRTRTKRSRRSKKIDRRTLRGYCYDSIDMDMSMMEDGLKTNEKIFIGASDVDDYITSELLMKRFKSGSNTVMRETNVITNKIKWREWIESRFNEQSYQVLQFNNGSGYVINRNNDEYLSYRINSNSLTVKVFGTAEFADALIKRVEDSFDVVTSYIEWMYSADGSSANVPLNIERLPVEEMYPFLKGESLASYYDRYLESSANILLLIGPPGTGKTTFIRGLLAHTQSSAIVTYDAAILEKDYVFARFIEGDDDVMVLEDSDAFLKSRSDGNTMMHRFLNVGDGLVTAKGKKMIFSTNLPSIRDIDSALIRPGRCFDIVTFTELTKEEAKKLADKLEVSLPSDKNGYSIAEIFNEQTNKPKERKIGFV